MTDSVVAVALDDNQEQTNRPQTTLRDSVKQTMEAYLKQLDGHSTGQLSQNRSVSLNHFFEVWTAPSTVLDTQLFY